MSAAKRITGIHHEEEAQDDAVLEAIMPESRMEAALLRENARPFRKSFLKLYGCIFVGYLCSATNGFDANTFGGSLFGNDIYHVLKYRCPQ